MTQCPLGFVQRPRLWNINFVKQSKMLLWSLFARCTLHNRLYSVEICHLFIQITHFFNSRTKRKDTDLQVSFRYCQGWFKILNAIYLSTYIRIHTVLFSRTSSGSKLKINIHNKREKLDLAIKYLYIDLGPPWERSFPLGIFADNSFPIIWTV